MDVIHGCIEITRSDLEVNALLYNLNCPLKYRKDGRAISSDVFMYVCVKDRMRERERVRYRESVENIVLTLYSTSVFHTSIDWQVIHVERWYLSYK